MLKRHAMCKHEREFMNTGEQRCRVLGVLMQLVPYVLCVGIADNAGLLMAPA